MVVHMKVTCIVTAYNEGPRIGYILGLLLSHGRIDEIIVVNDGSTDNTREVVESFLDQDHRRLKLVSHRSNLGKVSAFQSGLGQATGEIIICSDADVTFASLNSFDLLIDKLAKNMRMVVLDTSFIRKFIISPLGFTRLLSGQRSFYKKDLLKIDLDSYEGYSLEIGLNREYINSGLSIGFFYSFGADSALHFEKGDFKLALKTYMKIFNNVFLRLNTFQLIWQRVNSPIDEIRFAYFTDKHPRIRLVLAPFTLLAETVYGFWMFFYANWQYFRDD